MFEVNTRRDLLCTYTNCLHVQSLKSSDLELCRKTPIHPFVTRSNITMALNPEPKCLFFDVFGTCVNWRKTVTDTLWNAARVALNSPTSSIASKIRMVATDMVRHNDMTSA